MISFASIAFLTVAGVVAGTIGAAGGITSLVAYPALLAVGLPPVAANVTNSVALLGSGFGSSLRAGRDLRGHSGTLKKWLPITVGFSLVGAAALLLTPGEVFEKIVPWLVVIGSLALLLQPRLRGAMERRGKSLPTALVLTIGALVAVYNGYFGAGSGILMIAVLMLTSEPSLVRANAIKNVVLVAADILPAILFALSAHLVWWALWPLLVGSWIGGLIGPSVARVVNPNVLRVAIAVCGFVLAAALLLGWM
ncbi:sulfite exporter TauE/SafE family protein [Galactobacter valiniphilus]|uniref:sulfite exporter TauE/SafE family protein n=1 Tax=Galactobacter valiniphilus TaxID=2676122 RepID=UPI00373661BF